MREMWRTRSYFTKTTNCPRIRTTISATVKNIQLNHIKNNFRCPRCGGKGKVISKHCHVCHGGKIIKGLEELNVYIEKGMNNGHEIVK